MREKAIERRNINKEHNSNFKAGYVPIEEERLHKTGLRGRKGNMAVCIIVLLFLLALINLIVSASNMIMCASVIKDFLKFCFKGCHIFSVPQITLVIWTVIRIGPNGCDSIEFHESGLLRFKQKADMGVVHPLHKSTVGGRKDQDLVIVGNNNPVRLKLCSLREIPQGLETFRPSLLDLLCVFNRSCSSKGLQS